MLGLALSVSPVLAQSTYSVTHYSVTHLAVPGGPVVSDVRDMNAYGHVTGEAVLRPRSFAFYWDGTAIRDIGPPQSEDSGTCRRLDVRFDDGTTQSALFRFR